MVKLQPSKLATRVRFPSPAPTYSGTMGWLCRQFRWNNQDLGTAASWRSLPLIHPPAFFVDGVDGLVVVNALGLTHLLDLVIEDVQFTLLVDAEDGVDNAAQVEVFKHDDAQTRRRHAELAQRIIFHDG